jgi:exo-1,4-beta-D-glucosaminidase
MNQETKISLNRGWTLESSDALVFGGDVLSTPGADTRGWYTTDLPATVLGAQVARGEHGGEDGVFVGTALREIPGQGPPAQNFSNHPMPPDSPYAVAWWFRHEFHVPAEAGPHVRLQLDGINYRANVWLNGQRVGETLIGAYRVFELDVTDLVDRAGVNVLAIELTAPGPCDLALTWVDWNPSPPDKNMGIWRDVWLAWSGPVALRGPYVATALDGEARANLTVAGDLVNHTDLGQTVTVHAELLGRRVAQRVTLEPREQKRFEIDAAGHPELVVDHPELWWPRFMGEPVLHDVVVEVVTRTEATVSDRAAFAFGIREVTSELTADGYALHKVNGKPVLIRGAGWATDLFLRRQPERDLAQLEYVKALNLNTIRFEGMLERADILEWCDREGMLVIAGWCCCDCWEKWDQWKEENHAVGAASLASQLARVRRHPSMLSWWYGSDFPPPARVEAAYQGVIKDAGWPAAVASSAANKPTELSGKSGLKMEGPYEYVPPGYWYEDVLRGGAWGFATEISPGAAIPPIESIKKMIPEEHLWPIDSVWSFHAGGQEFHTVHRFVDALTARYGACSDVEDLARWSQVVTYEGQRAMFEAYTRNKYKATGVVQWMLNNAWPSMIWHLHDYFLRPGGGWAGTQKACEPLHVMYGYDDRGVVVTNQHGVGFSGLVVKARVLGLDPATSQRPWVFERVVVDVDVAADDKTAVMTLPPPEHPVTFVDLRLETADERLISSNAYWLPATPDVIDYDKAYWLHTPTAQHADLSALRALPPTEIVVRARRDGGAVDVELSNVTDRLAFFVQLRLADASGDDVLPIVWSDNYVSLLPGDARSLRASAPGDGALPRDVVVEARGLNTATVQVAVEPSDEGRQVVSAPVEIRGPGSGGVVRLPLRKE